MILHLHVYPLLSWLILSDPSYPLSCLTASLNKWIFTQMTPQLHLEFGTLRSLLSVPFVWWAETKKRNAKPPATFSTQRNLPGGTRGLPRVKTQRNILHQDHVAPVGVSCTPGWDSVKKPCENPGVCGTCEARFPGCTYNWYQLVGWNGKGFVWFLGRWGWRSWRSWRWIRWRVPCWGRIWLNKLNSISIHTAPRKHPKIDPVISQQSHWWNRFLHSATPRYGWTLKPQEHGTTNVLISILSPEKRILTEQICPKISNHKRVAQYNRVQPVHPFSTLTTWEHHQNSSFEVAFVTVRALTQNLIKSMGSLVMSSESSKKKKNFWVSKQKVYIYIVCVCYVYLLETSISVRKAPSSTFLSPKPNMITLHHWFLFTLSWDQKHVFIY